MERQALEELQQNTSIIIKPADKGSAIVILDREQYVQEALRQLQNITSRLLLQFTWKQRPKLGGL
jgi:hypothetical protein